jgi:UDP-sugar transporter A1/2/3
MLPLKYVFLVLLCLQNSSYTLLRRYSRGILQETYSASSLLMVSEIMKLIFSFVLLDPYQNGDNSEKGGWLNRMQCQMQTAVHTIRNGREMLVPALTYLGMNLLSFVSIDRVDATVFSMCAQLKILATAIWTKWVLGRVFNSLQWRSLWMLTVSVTIITYQLGNKGQHGTGDSTKKDVAVSEFCIGVCAVLVEVTMSGWISVYFEKYLKDRSSAFSVWARNLQLSFWSIVVYSLQIAVKTCSDSLSSSDPNLTPKTVMGDPEAKTLVSLVSASPFQGWSWLTVLLAILGAAGGILVALATKHADAVMKSLSTSAALVLTVSLEVLLLGVGLDMVVCLASGLTIMSLQNFQEASSLPKSPSGSPSAKDAQTVELTKLEKVKDTPPVTPASNSATERSPPHA